MSSSSIVDVRGLRVWDSRGRPTVEVEVTLASGASGRAIAPAGASTGTREALDLRSGGSGFDRFGVARAVANVNGPIRAAVLGGDAHDQASIDHRMVALDGTPTRERMGGNALIATSMAVAHAAAADAGLPLWRYLDPEATMLPVPEIQVFGGGAHATGSLDLQDYMIVPHGASSFAEATEWVGRVYYEAGELLRERNLRAGVADEGGYWPLFRSNQEALDALVGSIERAGFRPGPDISISLDIAANQLFWDGRYHLKAEERSLDPDEWLELLADWVRSYPVTSIEDPFEETDLARSGRLLARLDGGVQLVGDDLLATQVALIDRAAKAAACNTLLCKPNQVGTLTEARAAFDAARALGWETILSARSGETEDTTIVHLAVGWGARQLKVGSFSRSERMAKWNEAIRIEADLGTRAGFAGSAAHFDGWKRTGPRA